ncbi:MAG TPA: hypothetical protein VGW35_21445 [Methylomirabilota bacterium]|jgi:hypothetical protein|nr:hypothetical protein [Methylomirabilota bacterium]
MLPRRLVLLSAGLILALASCASVFSTGRDFPSPGRDAITTGTTAKPDLLRLFGEPTQVGIDDGDPTWTWLFFKKGNPDLTKQLTVRFRADGVVKSYSFTSNFPEDMKTLR